MSTRRGSSFIALLVLCSSWLLPGVAHAGLEIREVRWGFDGRRVYGVFNPLTITIHNPDEVPFQGVLELSSSELEDLGPKLGAPLLRSVYLSPGATRREQFYPLVRSTVHYWTLRWGKDGRETDRLAAPTVLEPARVLLLAPEVRRVPDGLHGFPAALFPRSAVALEGLAEVVLDHDPDWDSLQRQALVDWVVKGGALHVAPEDSGRHPNLSGELSVLVGDPGENRFGAGRLVFHSVPRRALTPATLGWEEFDEETDDLMPVSPHDGDLYVLDRLRGLSQPEHNWPLIYVMSLLYLVLVVPVNLIIGRKVKDYRVSILFLVGCVALFSAVFFVIGRRGFGEQASTYSYGVAEVVPGGYLDLHQYVHVFVTVGGDYTIDHEGVFHVYGTPRREETVPGMIINGADGKLILDMPLYSYRDYIHHARVAGGELVSDVVSWPEERGNVRGLEMNAGPGYPDEILEGYIVRGGECWRLQQTADGTLRPMSGTGTSLDSIMGLDSVRNYMMTHGYFRGAPPRRQANREDHVLGSLIGPQMARVLGRLPNPEGADDRPRQLRMDPGVIHVFVEAKTPEHLHPRGALRGVGRLLYHQVLVQP